MEEERHPHMIRTLTRNMICFFAAVVLLSLMVCALEVGLRAGRLSSGNLSGVPSGAIEELIAPSGTSWIDVKPLIDITREKAPNEVIRIRTNEHGLRGPSVVLPKPRGTFRVLCLGGDNVFGSEVDEKETFTGRLQRSLNMQSGMPVEVINAGCPNAGPLINLLRYRAHLSALQPDLVLLCLSEEDLGFDHGVRGALHLDESRNPAYASHPALRGTQAGMLESICEEFVTADLLLGWAGDMAGMKSGLNKATAAPVRGSVNRDLAAIVPLHGLISGNFGNMIVSVCPSAWSVDRARNSIDKTQSSFAEDIRKFLHDVRLADRIEVHDGLNAFRTVQQAQRYFSMQTGGLSVAGNDLYAQQMASFLLETIPGLGGTTTTTQRGIEQTLSQPR